MICERQEESASNGTLGQTVAVVTTRVDYGVILRIMSRYEMKRGLWETWKKRARFETAIPTEKTRDVPNCLKTRHIRIQKPLNLLILNLSGATSIYTSDLRSKSGIV